MMMDIRTLARAMGGEVVSGAALVPGPGHKLQDRSLRVFADPNAPDGFYVHSFANDDPIECRDYVRQKMGLPAWQPSSGRSMVDRTRIELLKFEAAKRGTDDGKVRTERALALWYEARPIGDTLAERYLTMRGVASPALEAGSEVLRFHPACPFGAQTRHPCLIALMRNIISNEPQAIQRAALTTAGDKVGRMTLGPKTGAAIKVSVDENVTCGLTIGEGLETVLGGTLLDYRPAWSVLDAAGIAGFPVLSGIEALTVLVDHDEAGLNAAQDCSERWIEAGREVLCVFSPRETEDVNDLIKRFSHVG
jgi:putative DNA primase/helicase